MSIAPICLIVYLLDHGAGSRTLPRVLRVVAVGIYLLYYMHAAAPLEEHLPERSGFDEARRPGHYAGSPICIMFREMAAREIWETLGVYWVVR